MSKNLLKKIQSAINCFPIPKQLQNKQKGEYYKFGAKHMAEWIFREIQK